MKKLLLFVIFLMGITDVKTYIGNDVTFNVPSNTYIVEYEAFIAITNKEDVFNKNADTLSKHEYIIFVFNPIQFTLDQIISGLAFRGYEPDFGLEIGYDEIYNKALTHDRLFAFKKLGDRYIVVAMFAPSGELQPNLVKFILDSLVESVENAL